MREIKFNYYWQHGETGRITSRILTLNDIANGEVNTYNNKLKSYGEPFAIAEYTGIKDKNGVEIYEGDLVTLNHVSSKGYIFEVVYSMIASFEMVEISHNIKRFFNYGTSNRIEVIGNIYEHKHLLKEN